MSKLKIVYEGYKNSANKFGDDVDLSLALVLLLLKDKDKFKSCGFVLGNFYNENKAEFDSKIEQVMRDFSVTEEDLCSRYEGMFLKEHEAKYTAFKNGLMMFMTILNNSKSDECCPEKLYETYHSAFGFPSLSEVEGVIYIDGRIDNIKYASLSLEERYYYHRIGYAKTGSHLDPNVLLSIILLMNKDNFGLMDCSNSKEFYEKFEYEINTYICCVMTEFSITEEELEDFRLGMSLDNSAILLDEDINMAQVDGFEFEKDMMSAITLSSDDKKYLIFKPAIDLLFTALKNPTVSNEVLHNCLVNRYKTKKKSDSSSKTTLLGERYSRYVSQYRETFKHPHPAELLTLLLIDSRGEFSCLKPYSEGYLSLINNKIEKVMRDFFISSEEILKDVYGGSSKLVSDYGYKIAKLRFFNDSIDALRVVLRDYRDYSDDICFLKILTMYGSNWRSGINYISKDSKKGGPKARKRRRNYPVPTGFKW